MQLRIEELRRSPDASDLYRLLWALPKGGDLHNHLTLSLRPEALFEKATDARRPAYVPFYARMRYLGCPDSVQPFLSFHTIPQWAVKRMSECAQGEYTPLEKLTGEQKAAWLSAMKMDQPQEGREEFFEALVARRQPMARNLDLLFNVVAEHLKERAAEGLRYLETQFVPVNGQDGEGRPIPLERGVGMTRALLAREDIRRLNLAVRFQFILIRFNPEAERSMEAGYEFVSRNRDLWVGVNFAGREDNDKGHAGRFLETVRKLRRTYPDVHLSLHAGETTAPGRQVRDTLLLGAERIGHGINLLSDPDTLLWMRGGRVLVETSLISNRLLQYTPDLAAHPFPELLRTGVPVCLNTDDPGAWDSNFTDEYFTAVKTYNLTWNEIVELGRMSLRHSFAEPELKERLLADYEAAVKRFEERYGGADWREKLKSVPARVSGYAQKTWGLAR